MPREHRARVIRSRREENAARLHPETKKSVWALILASAAVIVILASLDRAGPLGRLIFRSIALFFGWGYFMFPLTMLLVAGIFLFSRRQKFFAVTFSGAALLIFSILGLLELTTPGLGGWLGVILGSLRIPFGTASAIVIDLTVFLIGLLITFNAPLRIVRPERTEKKEKPVVTGLSETQPQLPEKRSGVEAIPAEPQGKTSDGNIAIVDGNKDEGKIEKAVRSQGRSPRHEKDYVPPPLPLLASASEKPTTGDLRANANIIKRTLESFGVPVEMGEINIGPKVTRYTLKPAEGVKLSKLTALHQDLALALAAHPIRIEAPIPGKSLVGVEVPNKAAALVRLGNIMGYQEFQKSGPLSFILGRDVSGEPIFADIERMPHLLIAGATGSGKSVMIHSILISLLYKNSPQSLKLVLVDPKRVELSIYEGIPHLISPVVAESKKAVSVFRWAIAEMERRYDLLLKAGSRDIKGYNANGGNEAPLPYLLIVVDELADLMTSYGRDVEGSIIRLAQMARATGLHLLLSTQRPSVEVITGLIKANITSRIAFQVASHIDSRTIIDMAGAEKLLGGGDLLFISSELSKPKRIQGAYVSEGEVSAVSDFIRTHNKPGVDEEETAPMFSNGSSPQENFDDYLEGGDDELYDEAVRVVIEAKKASASLLQRRLKVGYARAARLLDLMEAGGLIGPGEGAKPREIFRNEGRES